MKDEITYFWQQIFNSMVMALLTLAIAGLILVLVYAMERWVKARQKILKYRNGYNRAINDAIADINQLYDEWNADDPYSDIPSQKTITARLERLKSVSRRNIPE